MPPRTHAGKERALANLRQNRTRHERHGAHAISRAQPATISLAAEILAILDGDGLAHLLLVIPSEVTPTF